MSGYDRARDPPKVLPVQLDRYPPTTIGTAQLVRDLRRACRREVQRGWTNHFAYDKGRHARLAACLDQEVEALLRDMLGPDPDEVPTPEGAQTRAA